jgi:hypothetical protein
MNDPAGVPSPFGIETVEWFDEDTENLTVRVTGRWRRRRPAWSAQPTLVVEAPGRRHRFPAMPEPPSLSRTPPGKWRISFAVPATLAPELGGRAWLQFGAIAVPLPPAVEPLGAAQIAAATAEAQRETPEPFAEPQRETPQPFVEPSTAEGEAHPGGDGPSEPPPSGEPEGQPATSRAERVAVEAVEAAEPADELAQRGAPADTTDLAIEHERLGFEHVLVARRTGGASRVPSEPDVKGDAAAVAGPRPAHAAGGQGGAEQVKAPDRELIAALQAELEQRVRTEAALRARLVESETRIAARQLLERQTAATLGQLRDELGGLRGELEGLRGALAGERRGREAAERRAEALGRDLARLHVESGEAHAAVAELRGLIEELRAVVIAPATEVEPQPEPSARSGGVAAAPPTAEPAPAGATVHPAVQPANTADAEPVQDTPAGAQSAEDSAAKPEPADRLSEALVRLRDAIAPLDAVVGAPAAGSPGVPAAAPAPETVDRAWLRPVFTALVASAPDLAGRLLVDLLPAQRAVDPAPVAYDLVLGKELGCLRVTVDVSRTEIAAGERRPRSEVDFRVAGDHAALAKLMSAGRVRRRLGWGVARVRGKRGRLAALDHLLDTRLSFAGLHQAGVRMEPRTALTVVAQLIAPAWTSGAEFVLAYEASPEKPLYLVVADGAPVEVKDTGPQGAVATTISGPAGSLELVLAGMADEGRLVIGEAEPLTFLREWVNRAQSG